MKKSKNIDLQNYIINQFGDIAHECICGSRWMKSFKGSISYLEDDQRNKSLISYVENCKCFTDKNKKLLDNLLKDYSQYVSFDFESILCAIRDRKSVLNELNEILLLTKKNTKQNLDIKNRINDINSQITYLNSIIPRNKELLNYKT